MAFSMVKAAISIILQDKGFDLKTPRMTIARESVQKMLDAISDDNQDPRDTFTLFAMRLNEKIETLATQTSCKKLSPQKQHFTERLSLYLNLRTTQSLDTFETFVKSIHSCKC